MSPTEASLLVFDKRVGPWQIIMTANSEVIYAFSLFDLAKAGPVVVEVPAGLPGGFWDMWERGIEDIGIGRSAHRGKFLLVPPGSKQIHPRTQPHEPDPDGGTRYQRPSCAST